MQSNSIRRLREVAVVAELLSDPSKVVEDDTCLDRILTGLDHILTNYGNQMLRECQNMEYQFLSVFEKPTRNILDNPQNYASSSVSFLLKIHGLFLSQMRSCSKGSWMERVQFLICFPSENGFADYVSFSSSVQSAWIESIRYFISMPSILSDMATFLQVKNIILLIESSSIFVCKLACQCIAELILNLKNLSTQAMSLDEKNRFDQIVIDINKELLIKCSVADYTGVLTKMLDINYDLAVDVLRSLSYKCYLENHAKNLLEACVSGEKWVPHFLYSLFCEKMNENTFDLFSISSAYDFSRNTIEGNPSSPVGWKMMTSILMHIPSTYSEKKCMEDVLLCPLCTVLNNEKQSRMVSEKMRSLLNHRTKLGSALCNSLKGISYLWKHDKIHCIPSHILQLVDVVTGDQPETVPCLVENWKVGVTALQIITDNFRHFNTAESKAKLQDGILNFLKHANVNCEITKSCIAVVLTIFQSGDYDDSSLEFLNKLLTLFCRKLMDRRWQVRDTALEFFTQVLSVCCSHSECIKTMYSKNDVQKETLLRGKDPNSYVRASALQLLGQMLLQSEFCDRDEVMSLVIDILNNDKEAFSRRAAVVALLSFLKTSGDPSIGYVIDDMTPDFHDSRNSCGDLKRNASQQTENSQLISAVLNRILFQDLDWEVKWNALDILDWFIDFLDNPTRCPNAPNSKQQRKSLIGMLEKMVLDCDKAVRDKATQLLLIRSISSDSNSQISKKREVVKQSGEEEQAMSDLDALLEGVLLYLRREKQVKLSHGCHGPSLPVNGTDENNDDIYDDSVILDCY